ncbi:potassium voltage-gated channel subfamily KQT member 2-like [Dermacentor albipictus]|uniref:potassium voltage-gated channel subfamily KQT member 2-like n=2 Tax=Dermacentor TaxID=34619 RepID=UPI0031FC0CDB
MQALTDMELARLEQGGPRHGGSLLSLHTSLPSRTSLLGKPLKVGTHPRDAKYRKKQTFMYNFLERPRGYRAAAYHIFLLSGLPL